MAAEHASNAPVTTQAGALWAELCEVRQDRDRLLAKVEQLQRAVVGSDASFRMACADYAGLRDAVRAFLAKLDSHTFSAVSMRGAELDELREAIR